MILGDMRTLSNRFYAVIILATALSPISTVNAKMPVIQSPDKKLKAHIISFEELTNWQRDKHEQALLAFKRSCLVIAKSNQTRLRQGFMGTYSEWSRICASANKVPSNDRQKARRFFEHNFIPAQIISPGRKGLFTGYYEPELAASLKQTKMYNVPLYRKPRDLRRNSQTYFTRAEIEGGALKNRGLEFVYLNNPADAFFLHIQGSGRLFLDNGKVMRVGFAAKNGRPYTSIGKVLIDQGAMARKNMSMQSIRKWLTVNPRKAAGIMQKNQSFIFFRPLKGSNPNLGPPGAQGVPLTPKRSLAVDRNLHAYGQPLWVETKIPNIKTGGSKPFRQLMIAQDTGSAIKGAVRGDIFWGSGKAAGNIAGRMKQPGKLFLLLPRKLAEKYLAEKP